MEREATIRITALEKEVQELKKAVNNLQSVMLIAADDMKRDGMQEPDLVS